MSKKNRNKIRAYARLSATSLLLREIAQDLKPDYPQDAGSNPRLELEKLAKSLWVVSQDLANEIGIPQGAEEQQ